MLRVRPPPVPTTWKAAVPSGVAAEVLTVSVLVDEPVRRRRHLGGAEGARGAGGQRARTRRLTGALKRVDRRDAAVLVTLLPWTTDRLVGVQDEREVGHAAR